jgi:hypothetical protein
MPGTRPKRLFNRQAAKVLTGSFSFVNLLLLFLFFAAKNRNSAKYKTSLFGHVCLSNWDSNNLDQD